ncbi:MAG: hypothetical protein ACK5O2_15380, partial [Microthrixaceae bacterium]
MISLLRVLRDQRDAAEADLQRYYGIDLTAAWRSMSVRRLHVLIHHLPSEAAVNGRWSIGDHMTADLTQVMTG